MTTTFGGQGVTDSQLLMWPSPSKVRTAWPVTGTVSDRASLSLKASLTAATRCLLLEAHIAGPTGLASMSVVFGLLVCVLSDCMSHLVGCKATSSPDVPGSSGLPVDLHVSAIAP
jgi:hypothetical protein